MGEYNTDTVAPVTLDDFQQDLKRLEAVYNHMESIANNERGLSQIEQQRALYKTLEDDSAIHQKYKGDENELYRKELEYITKQSMDRIKSQVLDAYGDYDPKTDNSKEMKNYEPDLTKYDKMIEAAENPAPSNPQPDITDSRYPEFHPDIDKLRTLYEATLSKNMTGLNDEAKLVRYEAFADAYYDIASKFDDRKDEVFSDTLRSINKRIGMPDKVFEDGGAERLGIYANQLKTLADRADKYSMDDARNALIATGEENPSNNDVQRHYALGKENLYQKTLDRHEEVAKKFFINTDDMHHIRNQAGFSKEYLERQIEIANITFKTTPPDAPLSKHYDRISDLSDKLEDKMQRADKYSMADAKNDLIKSGIENPGNHSIEQQFISTRINLYDSVLSTIQRFEENDDEGDAVRRLENNSGITVEHLEVQLEILEMHQQELEQRVQEQEQSNAAMPADTHAKLNTSSFNQPMNLKLG